MRQMTISEVKYVQISVLNEIHNYCIKNDIKYSLACGTLIGAIRHKGYIPWDDDIDIYLLRDEYNKLINTFPKVLNNVTIASLETDKEWDRPYANAYMIDTIKEEDSVGTTIGVGIDIFPIDSVPQNVPSWSRYHNYLRILQSVFMIKRLRISRKRAFLKTILIAIAHLVLLLFSSRFIAEYIDGFIKRHSDNSSKFVFESCQGITLKNPFLKEDFQEQIDVEFEGRQYKALKGFDRYLTMAYGDYMIPPPIEKQTTHHSYKAYWIE